MCIFKGSGVALITPFYKDGTINFPMMKKLIDFHCENKTDAIIICGTTGESAGLTDDEKIACFKAAVEYTAGRVPVIAGTGTNATFHAIRLTKAAEEAGVDGLLIVTPYYNKTSQEGLIVHYTAIAKETKLPIIMYNVPSRTGLNMTAETSAHLINSIENIVGIKEASGNISQVAKITALTHGHADIYSGNDDQIVPFLSLGAKGVISVLANVAPVETHNICEYYFDGKFDESLELQLKSLNLIEHLFCEVNPIPIKKAMHFIGYEVGDPRLPLYRLSPEKSTLLLKAMQDYGL